jgi:hypothetical protein
MAGPRLLVGVAPCVHQQANVVVEQFSLNVPLENVIMTITGVPCRMGCCRMFSAGVPLPRWGSVIGLG